MHRKTNLAIFALALLGTSLPAYAEEAGDAAPADSWMADMVGNFQFTGGRLIQLAKATPANKFGWSPNDDVRSVSEVYMHVVGANMLMPMMLGAPPAEGLEVPEEGPMALAQKWESEITDKDAVIAKLEASFAYAAEAMPKVPNLDESTAIFGFEDSKRAYLMVLVGHAHEHLGQSIAYARSNGIVPPWSQPAPEEGEQKEDG